MEELVEKIFEMLKRYSVGFVVVLSVVAGSRTAEHGPFSGPRCLAGV
jgi:hypothetical protein